MAKRTGAARAEQRHLDEEPLPKNFSYRPDDEFNVELREYLITQNVSFNELCDLAVHQFLARHPRWPHRTLRRPRGKRPTV